MTTPALAMRQGQAENDVFAKLAADERLGLTSEQLQSLVAEPITFTGVLKKVQWMNPHIYTLIETKAADGKPVVYRIEERRPASGGE